MKNGSDARRAPQPASCTTACEGRIDLTFAAGVQGHSALLHASARQPARLVIELVPAKVGLTSRASTVALGTSSRSNSSRFPSNAVLNWLTPVTLPPGRLRLATRPSLTGSCHRTKTIGIVVVAALAASAAGVRSRRSPRPDGEPGRPPAPAAGHIGPRPSGIRSPRSGPRHNPISFRPWRNPRRDSAMPSGDWLLRNPITGIAGCCARAASGHAAAAPPSSVMNSRRFIRSPRRRGRAATAARRGRAPWRSSD